MKRSILSEKGLVVVMFIMVVAVFSFAQADTKEIEKRYLNSDSPATTSLNKTENTEANLKTTETKHAMSLVQLR
jgi:hypothetical protein